MRRNIVFANRVWIWRAAQIIIKVKDSNESTIDVDEFRNTDTDTNTNTLRGEA